MPSPSRTVFDGLEGAWEEAESQWRRANALREQAERKAAQTIDGAKVRLADVGRQVRDSQPAAVVDALFGTTPGPGGRQRGAVDYRKVDRRRAQTRSDITRYRRASAVASPEPEPTSGWPGAAAAWYARVKHGGEWDDRTRAEKQGKDWRPYEYQGNFSYGATAEALGLPESVALWGAGAAQRWDNFKAALAGMPLKTSEGPYGDDSRDQEVISEGYRYGRRASAGSR